MTPMLIQIQRWLMQPKVWRFVGFASTVVGLFCYALSSSFNHLFGEWNLLKISLYSVFSIIICLAMLFAKVWQHSTSLRFKAHLAFLVLAITSVYSFFFDKAVNGKPDAYSLISCAAFAIMFLSLSRQIHCGFEVDLLYFFLGCLIVQLMKIKLLLAIVGAGFSYPLIILRSSLDAPSETENLGLQDHVVIQVDSQQANNGSAIQVDSSQANNSSALIIMPQQVDSQSQQANTDSALIIPQLKAQMGATWSRSYAETMDPLFQMQQPFDALIENKMIGGGVDFQQLRYRSNLQIGEMGGRGVEGSERSKGSEGEVQGIEASPSRPRKSRTNDLEKKTIMIPAPLVGNTEMPLEDGFTWRKYGQKDILGSKYPRSYYRCTHQKLYACPAKKQVQRLDQNPNIFEVTYRGQHTCHKSSTAPSSFPPPQLLVDISKDLTQSTISPHLSPSSTSVSGSLSSVSLSLGGGMASAGAGAGGSAGPSTSKYGTDYLVADMADVMFNSVSSSGNNSMESLFPLTEDKWDPSEKKS